MGFFGDAFDAFLFPEEYKDLGTAGERRTLRMISDYFSGGQIFRNVYLKRQDGKYTEIDLIAIAERGIFVFESKNYSGWIFGNEGNNDWTQILNGNKRKFYNPIWQNNTHIRTLKYNLQQFPRIKYYSIVVFSERCELKDITHSEPDTYIVKRNDLDIAFSKIRNSRYEETISRDGIKKIVDILAKAQRPNKAVQEQHIADVKNTINSCPRCHSELVERKNKTTGESFYGCKSYPKCKYTAKELK